MSVSVDATEVFVRLIKYTLEGFLLAVAAYFIPGKKLAAMEVFVLGLVAAATFAVLDLFAPSIGSSVRSGAGYGIGFNLANFPGGSIVTAI